MDKRFIEDSFPVKDVSEESAKERRIRHGQISSLHIWWTRKPLIPSRSTNYAALIPLPNDEIEWIKKRNFIIKLSQLNNLSNENVINSAKEDISYFFNGIPPKILDPYSGGGSIPLEALNLGCETYANDYNPVAVLIEKCTLEYPQRYCYSDGINSDKKNFLLNEIKKWGKIVINEVENEIGHFYPNQGNLIPSSYIWTRTIKCENPSCETDIPLATNWWLARTKNKQIALKPFVNGNKVDFEIVGQDNKIPSDYDPYQGTIKKAIVQCPVCGTTIDAKTTRKLFSQNKTSERMVCVVYTDSTKKGKIYKIPLENDFKVFKEANIYLKEKSEILLNKWGYNPVPNEKLPPIGTLGFRVQRYGLLEWGDLFNNRQKLCLITLMEKIKEVYTQIAEKHDENFAKVIITYLSLAFDRTLTFTSNLTRWKSDAQCPVDIFARQALPMTFNYAENNPIFPHSGAYIDQVERILYSLEKLFISESPAIVGNFSATKIEHPDNYFDAVFTDPPYYDNVPYSYLSDFFYVWIKRILDNLYPDLFITPLTPKTNEVVAYSHGPGGLNQGKITFEDNLRKSFSEIYRILKINGIATIVYAHKTTSGWETVINAILDSGLTVTASWPISTEMTNRLRAKRSATLASSIYIIARKFEKQEIGWFKDVKDEIRKYVPQKLDRLWEEGISGADFFIAAIGSAIEIFGKYSKVIDNQGNEVRADRILTYLRSIVTDYTVRQILQNGIADELSPLTKFYLLWRWNYGDSKVPFDEARKLSQSAGIDLINEWNKGFIIKQGEFISVIGPEKRDEKSLNSSIELIDVLHHICILWKNGKKDEIGLLLKKSGYDNGEALYKVAQAISETLPNSSSEKKMIEGFLAGKERIMQDIKDDDSQTKLV